MPVITLADGQQKQFDHAITAMQLAESISPSLAKRTLAAHVNDRLVDTSYLIEADASVRLVTLQDEAGLEVIRHSTAHLLAQAVQALFPSAQVTIGPVIENGFYYDFAFERGFTEDDLKLIEEKMHEIAKQNLKVERLTMTREQAIDHFRSLGENYKVQIIEAIPANEVLSFYRQGDFMDLCRGPHVPSTQFLKHFKLMKVAGAYWRGDSNNEMLQRIYGTAWAEQAQLENYLHQLAEAEKRDHRKLAKQLDLFHLQEEAPGMVFWHDAGWTIYLAVTEYIRARLKNAGYQEVHTPQIVDRSLWERSGHWEKFGEEMFTISTEDRQYAVKPMNCPCHIQIFNHSLRSYRELPLRMAEFGCCHRNEASGALHGLMRVKSLTQDDAHIFCTEDQVQSEASAFMQLLYSVYQDFGFNDVIVKLSTRPEKRIGNDAIWDKAEQSLMNALDNLKIQWHLNPGEGAFYGPKIEFHLKDSIGRVWQCGTLQLDFALPERLGAEYVAEDSTRKTPVMLHRAICGSLERFIGILIEHYAGLFPTWLAPVQVVVCNITDRQAEYVHQVTEQLKQQGIRVKSDLRNEKIGFKIREHTLLKVPYLLVIGDRECELQQVSVRKRNGQDLGSMAIDDFGALMQQDIKLLSKSEMEATS